MTHQPCNSLKGKKPKCENLVLKLYTHLRNAGCKKSIKEVLYLHFLRRKKKKPTCIENVILIGYFVDQTMKMFIISETE